MILIILKIITLESKIQEYSTQIQEKKGDIFFKITTAQERKIKTFSLDAMITTHSLQFTQKLVGDFLGRHRQIQRRDIYTKMKIAI